MIRKSMIEATYIYTQKFKYIHIYICMIYNILNMKYHGFTI